MMLDVNLKEISEFVQIRHADQKYGERPYFYHLEKTVEVCRRFGFLNGTLLAACYGHDLLEDTETTVDDLKLAGFPETSIDIIKRVTDEPGKNRKEKKAKTYPKIKNDFGATLVKLCDRIANVEATLEDGSGLIDMYRKEYQGMKDGIQTGDERLWPLWHHLDKLLVGENNDNYKAV